MLSYNERDLYEQAVQDASYTKRCCVRWHYASLLFNGSGGWRQQAMRRVFRKLQEEDWTALPSSSAAGTLFHAVAWKFRQHALRIGWHGRDRGYDYAAKLLFNVVAWRFVGHAMRTGFNKMSEESYMVVEEIVKFPDPPTQSS